MLAVDEDVRSGLQRVADADVDNPQEVMAKVSLEFTWVTRVRQSREPGRPTSA